MSFGCSCTSSPSTSPSPSFSSSCYFSLGSDKKINISNYSVVNNVTDFHTLYSNSSTKPSIIKEEINDTIEENNGTYVTTNKAKPSKFMNRLLTSLSYPNNSLISIEESQKRIESIIFDVFQSVLGGNTDKFIREGINTELINPLLNKYLLGKIEERNDFIYNYFDVMLEVLKKVKKKKSIKSEDVLAATLFTSLSKKQIFSFCLATFLRVYTFKHAEDEKII